MVAYLQPIGRPEIARIRGVCSDAVVAGLLERELIEEAGRGDGLGAPVLYRTTTVFERIFGLEEGIERPSGPRPPRTSSTAPSCASACTRSPPSAAEALADERRGPAPQPLPRRLRARLAARGGGARDRRSRRRSTASSPTSPGQRVPEGARVALDGRPVAPDEHAYVLLHKPADVVTTVRDTHGRRTVIDLVGADRRLFPIGRLDADTTGLLLLTNDGDLAARLMHPRHGVEKTYEATVRRRRQRRDGGEARGGRRAGRAAHGAGARARAARLGPAERRRDRAARGPQAPGAAHVRGGRPPRALAAPLRLRRPAARHARAGRLAAAAPGRARAAAQRGGGADVAATRLNRYLALAGLGTRRGVEGLVRAGRVASTASSPWSRRQPSSPARS